MKGVSEGTGKEREDEREENEARSKQRGEAVLILRRALVQTRKALV